MIIAMRFYDDVDMIDVAGPYEMFRGGLTVALLAEKARLLKPQRLMIRARRISRMPYVRALWVPAAIGGACQSLGDNSTDRTI